MLFYHSKGGRGQRRRHGRRNKDSKNGTGGEYEFFTLDASFPDRTVKIGKDLFIGMHMKIAKVIIEFKCIFAWKSDDLGRIPKEITEH